MKRQRQSKAACGSDHGISSDVSAAMVHEIHRVIRKAVTFQMMEIGQYVLDTVFQSDPRRALSAARHSSTVVGKISRTQRAPDQAAHVHRLRRIKQP